MVKLTRSVRRASGFVQVGFWEIEIRILRVATGPYGRLPRKRPGMADGLPAESRQAASNAPPGIGNRYGVFSRVIVAEMFLPRIPVSKHTVRRFDK